MALFLDQYYAVVQKMHLRQICIIFGANLASGLKKNHAGIAPSKGTLP